MSIALFITDGGAKMMRIDFFAQPAELWRIPSNVKDEG
jgi:hypothetical protein